VGEEQPHELVRLITRLVVAQAIMTAAVGLPFSRRQVPTIMLTLTVVAALCMLAVIARTGTHLAWLVLLAAEGGYVVIGIYRFFFADYLGGTIFAMISCGLLLHPAVARAYPYRAAGEPVLGEPGLEEAAGRALGGSTRG